MNEIFVQYQGFHPTEFTRSYLETKLNEIHERAPYGSTLRAVFVRDAKGRIKAQLSVNSVARDFFAVADGRRLRETSRRVLNQIHKQLERWKSERHGGRNNGLDVA